MNILIENMFQNLNKNAQKSWKKNILKLKNTTASGPKQAPDSKLM